MIVTANYTTRIQSYVHIIVSVLYKDFVIEFDLIKIFLGDLFPVKNHAIIIM